jgi:hypothetical protein
MIATVDRASVCLMSAMSAGLPKGAAQTTRAPRVS